MAKIITNAHLDGLDGMEKYWSYNGLDCAITREVYNVISRQLTPATDLAYRFEMAMQAPAFAMMLRGVCVDDNARAAALRDLQKLEKQIEKEMQDVVGPDWEFKKKRSPKCDKAPKGKKHHKWPDDLDLSEQTCAFCGLPRLVSDPFNPRSPKQVQHLLYEVWGLPKQRNRRTHLVSVDDECLEHLANKFPERKPVLDRLMEARKVRKQIGFMKAPTGIDGRMHSSFNVGATETFRWSSSKAPDMTGVNIQQIADPWRNVFVPDPGMELGYADLEQAESRIIAYDAQDEAFISVHQSSDTHTEVAKLIWPETVLDRTSAELPVAWDSDPQHNYRFYAKKIVHGSNLGMSPVGIAREAHIPIREAEEMQTRYFAAFPRVRARQKEIIKELQETGRLTNPLGVERAFFGRLWDEHVWKEGFSFIPQSMVGFILSIGLWRVWHDLDPGALHCIAQVHDAILFQYPKDRPEVLQAVHDKMLIPLDIRGRTCTIPVEIMVGPNWKKKNMRKWKPAG
jgi:DNA polymerase I-like protein with 3'-5' exonuclease and polymerase domains